MKQSKRAPWAHADVIYQLRLRKRLPVHIKKIDKILR